MRITVRSHRDGHEPIGDHYCEFDIPPMPSRGVPVILVTEIQLRKHKSKMKELRLLRAKGLTLGLTWLERQRIKQWQIYPGLW